MPSLPHQHWQTITRLEKCKGAFLFVCLSLSHSLSPTPACMCVCAWVCVCVWFVYLSLKLKLRSWPASSSKPPVSNPNDAGYGHLCHAQTLMWVPGIQTWVHVYPASALVTHWAVFPALLIFFKVNKFIQMSTTEWIFQGPGFCFRSISLKMAI